MPINPYQNEAYGDVEALGHAIQSVDHAQEVLITLEDRLNLLAKIIGPSHSSGTCEELDDGERRGLEIILRDAANDAAELMEWAVRLKPTEERVRRGR